MSRPDDPAPVDAPAVRPVAERLRAEARKLFTSRRVVLAHLPVAGATPFVTAFREFGAERTFVVAPTVGTGELPDPTDAEWYSLDIEGDTMAVFRAFERAMLDPPDALRVALDAFDRAGDALVLVMPFDTSTSVAGRRAYGARRPEWVALEDKTTNDALFERAGVATAPSEVVAAGDRRALDAAAVRLDRGAGTVWSGDAREGFNGGGSLVRHVRDPAAADDVADLLAARLRPRAGRALPRRHPLQHPRHRHRRRHRRVPADGDGDVPDSGRVLPLRGRRVVLGPAAERPRRHAGRGPAASARCCATRSGSPARTVSTAC